MEPKAKTMQERFGFSDPDLKTPEHDAIMMWLDGEMEGLSTNNLSTKKVGIFIFGLDIDIKKNTKTQRKACLMA